MKESTSCLIDKEGRRVSGERNGCSSVERSESAVCESGLVNQEKRVYIYSDKKDEPPPIECGFLGCCRPGSCSDCLAKQQCIDLESPCGPHLVDKKPKRELKVGGCSFGLDPLVCHEA